MVVVGVVCKCVYAWFFFIPGKFTVLALLFYCLLIYLFFGSLDAKEINFILVRGSTLYFTFWTLIGFPFFISFFSMFGFPVVDYAGKKYSNQLEKVMKYRDGQMKVSSDKESFEILKKTAMLDAIENNQDKVIYQQALRGMEATYGNDGPATIFKKLTNQESKD